MRWLTFYRYLLDEEYQEKLPFLSCESAHLNISFSYIAILNSCDNLIPSNFTEAQRATVAVKGFHGLLTYAIAFWYKHLLECFQKHAQLSTELLDQLQFLLRYRKEITPPKDTQENTGAITENQSLQGLSHSPEIKKLMLDILRFKARSKSHSEAALDKSPEMPLATIFNKLSRLCWEPMLRQRFLISSRWISKFFERLMAPQFSYADM
ncbi:hypothetical protein BTUL_0294g00040 [Botrytis tulipae]|uniref:Uncharacterized protein n=1 Tax=Botrytis tulipae TaxID=87230 RepID=A0A4Z1E7E3_9HELO|nr:hypothetical protein BTUL_0294g00040 [Botrytis tulipae]